MSVAIRAITRLQDADDINVSLGVGVDEYALCWDNDTAKFVLRAPAAPFAGILATGATVGATSQAQAFSYGIVGPSWKPSADSTTALQLQKADGTSVLNVDTTNGRVSIGRAPEGVTFAVNGNIQFASGGEIGYRLSSDTTIPVFRNSSSALSRIYTGYAGGKRLTVTDPSIGTDIATFDGVNIRFGIGTSSPTTRLDIGAGALTMAEMTAPTGAANNATLYTKDNGSGKTALCCKLGDDVEIVLATQA